jgi:hypothetical protein
MLRCAAILPPPACKCAIGLISCRSARSTSISSVEPGPYLHAISAGYFGMASVVQARAWPACMPMQLRRSLKRPQRTAVAAPAASIEPTTERASKLMQWLQVLDSPIGTKFSPPALAAAACRLTTPLP